MGGLFLRLYSARYAVLLSTAINLFFKGLSGAKGKPLVLSQNGPLAKFCLAWQARQNLTKGNERSSKKIIANIFFALSFNSLVELFMLVV